MFLQQQQLLPNHDGGSCCDSSCGPVYEIAAGQPSWCKLYRLVTEKTALMVVRAIVCAIRVHGRSSPSCEKRLNALKNYLNSELPTDIIKDVLEVCLARDRFR